ncbi:MAG: outer membrane beta-barrel family protein, partial [Marinirhabdus sp.]
RGFNTNLGIEYYITETSSVTASGFFRSGDDEDTTENLTDEFDRNNTLAISRVRTELETEKDENYQFSLNYVNDLDKNGHKLTADFQYETGDETKRSLITERNTLPVTDLPAENIIELEKETEYLVQVDYVLPIGENAQFEAGYRGNFEESTNDYTLTEEVGTTGNFVRNDSLSNIFTYNQNVNALYTQYGNKFGQFSFLLGLRYEATALKGNVAAEDVTNNEDELNINFDNAYRGLFPTVNLTYELGERENITLGYNRRINRPRGFFINPFPSRSSEANVFQGNPSLAPAYASAFDLGYLKRWKKLTLTASVYYQHETGAFERIQENTGLVTENGIPIIRTLPINLSTNDRVGFEAGFLYNPTRWLRMNGSLNFFRFSKDGAFNGVDYSAKNTSYFARGSVKLTLPWKIDWQTNAFYRGPSNNAQTETKGFFSANLALSKDILNDNGTIAFNISDVFNSRKFRSFTATESFSSDRVFQFRERQFTLSLIYRFNEKKK